MNVSELKELIKDLPDNVEVYREADTGQQAEKNPAFGVTDSEKLPYYSEDAGIEWMDKDEIPADKITAIVIG